MQVSPRFRRPLFLACGVAFSLAAAATGQTPVIGARGGAMGGAAAAVADDGAALWTNPAGLGRDPRIDVMLFGGASASNRGDFLGSVDRLSSLDLNRIRSGQDLPKIAGAILDLQSLGEPGRGVVGSGAAGFMFGKSGFAVGIGGVAYSAVYPTIDLVHILPVPELVDPAHAFSLNQTGVTLLGLEAREVRAGYGTSLFGNLLLVGGTVRYIKGSTYFVRRGVFDEDFSDPVGTARKAFYENRRDTSKIAFDAGAMVTLFGKVRVGLVSTAINEPEFDVAKNSGESGSTYNPALVGSPGVVRLPRTLRAGVAVQPLGILLVAVDYDLRETDTLAPGIRSRQLAAGAELKLALFAIRAGTFRDTAAVDAHWAYSAGFGIGLNTLSVNAAVIFSTEGGTSLSSTDRRDLGGAIDARFRF